MENDAPATESAPLMVTRFPPSIVTLSASLICIVSDKLITELAIAPVSKIISDVKPTFNSAIARASSNVKFPAEISQSIPVSLESTVIVSFAPAPVGTAFIPIANV